MAGRARPIRCQPVRRYRGGAKHRAAGMGLAPIPWRQVKRAAPQARRREGLEPNGRDGVVGTGRSPQSPVVRSTDPPRMYLYQFKPLLGGQARHIPHTAKPFCLPIQRSIRSTAPRRVGEAPAARQAAWGLLRDQIRSCVPFSPSIRRA
ncbi:hypothetical protein SAMN05421875_11549 [Acidovorax soli]|jgi:hypothetical protein|uniref:Uncharacterized protein n=1 Tax=Acidovorax soli TaxID=592050 RepID=A0A1H4BPN2_9BURK|nr:hypothetical protein GCM10010975_01000 [Comamonas phosphati]SEA50014.1 hypothetical protein SAMN05421875_11549 [Acidovorax soli]